MANSTHPWRSSRHFSLSLSAWTTLTRFSSLLLSAVCWVFRMCLCLFGDRGSKRYIQTSSNQSLLTGQHQQDQDFASDNTQLRLLQVPRCEPLQAHPGSRSRAHVVCDLPGVQHLGYVLVEHLVHRSQTRAGCSREGSCRYDERYPVPTGYSAAHLRQAVSH